VRKISFSHFNAIGGLLHKILLFYCEKFLFFVAENLELICNVRVDTVLFDFPPARTGKCG